MHLKLRVYGSLLYKLNEVYNMPGQKRIGLDQAKLWKIIHFTTNSFKIMVAYNKDR